MAAQVTHAGQVNLANEIKTPKTNHLNFRAFEKIENEILNRADISPKELLRYQMMAQRFQLQIEFATRIADSVNSGIKKLQMQNQ